MTSRSRPRGTRDRQSWHTPQGCTAAPQRGRTNPAVYHYICYRLNTRPGEGMTECVPYVWVWVCACVHMHQSMLFFPLFLVKVVVSQCVYVPVWAHWLLSPPLPYILSGEQQRECVQACLCVCVRNAEQLCSPPQPYEKKKKVTARRPLWNTRCSFGKTRQLGCLHFSDWEGKKTRCPPELRPYRDHSHRHGWQTGVCLCCECVLGGLEGVDIYRRCWA